MNWSVQIAKQLRTLYFGKNWTAATYKQHLQDVTYEEATQTMEGFNNIAMLVNHTLYYMRVQMPVLNGGALVASDKESFEYPPPQSEEEWQTLLAEMWTIVEDFAAKVESLPDDIWETSFGDEKYGSYYRNIQGTIEHSHYHLGQIVYLKKWIRAKSN